MAELQHSSARSRQRWTLVAILALAAALRLAQLNVQSLSMDEVKDLATARGGWATIQNAENRFPPLYHTLLWGWLQIVPGDPNGRGFSALCGVLTVFAVGRLGRVVGGDATELWAAGLAAIAPLGVFHSVEVRVYALYFFLAAVALWQFTAALVDGERRHLIGFAIAALAAVYTHYYAGLLIALTGLVFLASGPTRAQLLTGLAAFAVIGVGCLPALWMLRGDLDQAWGFARTSNYSLAGLGYTYFSYLSGYTLGPSVRELHVLGGRAAAIAAAPWTALLGGPTIVLLLLAAAAIPRDERRRWAAWFLLLAIAPAAIVGVLSLFASFGYNARHMAWAAIPLWVMLAHGAAHGTPRQLALFMAAWLAIGLAIANFNRVFVPAHQNEDMRAVAAALTASEARPTFALSGYMVDPLAYYLPGDWPLAPLPDAAHDVDATELAMRQLRKTMPNGGWFWLVRSREFHADPRGEIFASLEVEGELELVEEFAGAKLYRGMLGP